ncbi:MAG: peptide chain release factor N(5)-glutamine methyltransferase [Planctomycetota bacterium]|nr:MAG: peptide chain release factor N(5)-glutamine methyltransferase [Planctomycetota bacterium]GDY08098.1 release factor glutamine methyltransferase [Planctomycetia bacterium]
MSDAPPTPAGDVWTVKRILDWTIPHLKSQGSESPRLDAEILLAHARGCLRIQLYTNYDQPLTDPQRVTMRDLVKRRAAAEPVAYLVGHREFFGLDFRVTKDVLIPRPDTETLVVDAIEILKPQAAPRVLDVGTGSGCIAISLAVNCPNAEVTAIDLSQAALNIARANAETHSVAGRIRWLCGDLFAPLTTDTQFDLIASNPPYIASAEIETLAADVRLHEPRSALDGGPDGLDVIRRLIAGAPQYLVPQGKLLIEISGEQADAVTQLLAANGRYDDIAVLKDLAKQPRVVRAVRKG